MYIGREGGKEGRREGGSEGRKLPVIALTDVVHFCEDNSCSQHYRRYEHGRSN